MGGADKQATRARSGVGGERGRHPQRTRFICTGRGIASTYADGVDYAKFAGDSGTVRVERNSHVDPLPGNGVRWAIFWLGPFKEKFGECTDVDDRNQPFLTKQAAVDHEMLMIDRDYYRMSG